MREPAGPGRLPFIPLEIGLLLVAGHPARERLCVVETKQDAASVPERYPYAARQSGGLQRR